MLIYDMNQVATAAVMVQQMHSDVPTSFDFLRHMILTRITQLNMQFNDKEVVLAFDHRKNWRYQAFKYYKASRGATKAQIAPNLDWKEFHQFLNIIADELREHFPYIVIQEEGAEGDDIIGTIVHHTLNNSVFGDITILSGDKDFKQLHLSDRVRQFSPVRREFITTNNAMGQLEELILCGDRGDGVPNVLSPDDCFVRGIKQSKMTAKRKEEINVWNPELNTDKTIERNVWRNRVLVDLRSTPAELKQRIIDSYNRQLPKQKAGDRTRIFGYLVRKGLIELQNSIGAF